MQVVNTDDDPVTIFEDAIAYFSPVRGRTDQTYIVLNNNVTIQIDKAYEQVIAEYVEMEC